jgi:hypothetical protein
MHGQTYEDEDYAAMQKQYYMNISLLKPGLRFEASRRLKKMFNVSPLHFHAGTAQTD